MVLEKIKDGFRCFEYTLAMPIGTLKEFMVGGLLVRHGYLPNTTPDGGQFYSNGRPGSGVAVFIHIGTAQEIQPTII